MKIGVDVRCLMNGQYSGVSWYTYNLLKSVFGLDSFNQYLLFYNSNKKMPLPEFPYANVSYRGFRYPNKLFNLSSNFLNFPKADKLIGGVDLFFVPNFHFISWSDSCRKVITVHDLSFLSFPEFFTARMRLRHKLIIKSGILKRADMIIADSFSTKDDLISLLEVPEEKIKVVHLGVEQKYFTEPGADELLAVKNKYQLPDRFILSLSTIEPRKNFAGVISAYKLSRSDAALVIAGGRGWKMPALGQLAGRHQQIKTLGYVDEKDKPALYRLASLLAYPSFYEGFGLPLLEAMASGCPVIGGANSSQPEVIGEGGLLVDPYNVTQIAEAMKAILDDEQLRQRLIKKGRERAESFGWDRTAAQTLEIFNNLKS